MQLTDDVWTNGAFCAVVLEESPLNSKEMAGRLPGRNLAVRYFWISIRMRDSVLRDIYCLTESILADFFTKPLQGSLIRTFRNVISAISTSTLPVVRHVLLMRVL